MTSCIYGSAIVHGIGDGNTRRVSLLSVAIATIFIVVTGLQRRVKMSAEDIVKLLNDGPEALSDPEVRAIVENYFYEVTDGKLNLATL